MSMFISVLMVFFLFTISPVSTAILILVTSISMAVLTYKMTMISLISFMVILVFSSGMMILFMYAASLSSNKTMKTKKVKITMLLFFILVLTNMSSQSFKMTSMGEFTSQMVIIFMVWLLVVTMISISSSGFHPHQILQHNL